MAKNDSTKKLTRSKTSSQIMGVCGGLGEYFGVDPTIVRLGAVILALLTGVVPMMVLYFIAGVVIPQK